MHETAVGMVAAMTLSVSVFIAVRLPCAISGLSYEYDQH